MTGLGGPCSPRGRRAQVHPGCPRPPTSTPAPGGSSHRNIRLGTMGVSTFFALLGSKQWEDSRCAHRYLVNSWEVMKYVS